MPVEFNTLTRPGGWVFHVVVFSDHCVITVLKDNMFYRNLAVVHGSHLHEKIHAENPAIIADLSDTEFSVYEWVCYEYFEK